MSASFTNHRIREAVRWLVENDPADRPHPVIPDLKQRFALSTFDACQAIAEANRQRAESMAATQKGGAR